MNSKSKVITGSILVLSGAATVLGNMNILNENFILPVLGAAFLIIYFILGGRKKHGNIGFLIPGVILPALQVLEFVDNKKLQEKTEILTVFGVLGASFLAIYLIHCFRNKELTKGQRNWPMYVSIILVLIGTAAYAVEYFNWSFGILLFANAWPGVLVIVGFVMLYKALKENSHKIKD